MTSTKTTMSIRIRGDQIEVAAKRAATPRIRRATDETGKKMVEIANRLMAGEFDLDRPYERRRYPGSRRASNALDYTVTEEADGTLDLRYRVLGGPEVFKRILGMNFGTGDGHEIRPSGRWELKGRSSSSVQRTRFGGARRKSKQNVLAWTGEDGQVVTEEVWHPGTRATGFLQEAAAASADLFGATLGR